MRDPVFAMAFAALALARGAEKHEVQAMLTWLGKDQPALTVDWAIEDVDRALAAVRADSVAPKEN